MAYRKGELAPKDKEPNYDNLEKKARHAAKATGKMTEIAMEPASMP